MSNLQILFFCLALFCTCGKAEKRHRQDLGKIESESSTSIRKSQTPSQNLPRSKNSDLDPPPTPTDFSGSSTSGSKAPRFQQNASTGSQSACTDKHSLEAFMQIDSAHSPQFATPQGVYFLSDLRDTPQLFFLKSPGGKPEQLTFLESGAVSFRVSPDGQKILVLGDEKGDEQYDAYLLTLPDKKWTPLLVDRTDRIESIQWLHRLEGFVFTSNARNKVDMDLYEFLLKDNKPTLVVELSGNHSVTDVSLDDEWVALHRYRSVTSSDVFVFNRKKKTIQKISPSSDGSYLDPRFTGNGRHIFYLNDSLNGFRELYAQSINDPKTGRWFTSGKIDIDYFAMDPARARIGIVTNQKGYSEFQGFEIDPSGKKRQGNAAPPLKKGVVQGLSFLPSGGFFFGFTSPKNPPNVWYWNSPALNQWTKSTLGQIQAGCFVEPELITYPSFDNLEISAFLFKPRTAEKKPYVIFPHGGPESQYRPVFSKVFQYWLERGFGVLAPNFRGSTGYGRSFTLLDNYKKRIDSVQDVISGTEWLLKKGYTQKGQIGIYGASYGGFLTLRAIQLRPELFSVASESVGITNFVTFLKNTRPYRRALREAEYGPLEDEKFLLSISPSVYVSKIQTPLLIFHGANDPRVPASETEDILKELKKLGREVEFKVFADEGHGNRKRHNQLDQARSLTYFFEKELLKNK